jgi:ABC-type multidrug transport system fused ATPase/permease subunit
MVDNFNSATITLWMLVEISFAMISQDLDRLEL